MKILILSFVFLFILSCKDSNNVISGENNPHHIEYYDMFKIDSLNQVLDYENFTKSPISLFTEGISEIADSNIISKINLSCVDDVYEGIFSDSCYFRISKIETKLSSIEIDFEKIDFDTIYSIEFKNNFYLIKKVKHVNNEIWDGLSIDKNFGYNMVLYKIENNKIKTATILFQKFSHIDLMAIGYRLFYINGNQKIYFLDLIYDESGWFAKEWNIKVI